MPQTSNPRKLRYPSDSFLPPEKILQHKTIDFMLRKKKFESVYFLKDTGKKKNTFK